MQILELRFELRKLVKCRIRPNTLVYQTALTEVFCMKRTSFLERFQDDDGLVESSESSDVCIFEDSTATIVSEKSTNHQIPANDSSSALCSHRVWRDPHSGLSTTRPTQKYERRTDTMATEWLQRAS